MPSRNPIQPGENFFRLTVISEAPSRKGSSGYPIYNVNVICDCGNTLIVAEYKLRAKHTKSCGCFQVEKARKNLPLPTHSKSKSSEYNSWQAIKARCLKHNHPFYKYYGGRGIKVCDRWLASFENFYEDMGPRPFEGYTVDRIDVNGNYCKENCKWSSYEDQHRNRSNNKNVIINGIKMCASEACKFLNVHESKLVRMVKALNIDHQKAVDLLMLNPRPVNMKQFRKILVEEKR